MTKQSSRFARAALLALGLAFCGGGLAAAASPAEDYIQTNVQRCLDILNNRALAQADRRAQFRALLESLTDLRRIALFTLGPVGRTASDADKDAFVAAFHDYAVAVYDTSLSHYNGQILKVTGSTQHAPGDFVVRTTLTDTAGHSGSEVDFRVLGTGARLTLMDASIEGIWLSQEERDQFTAFLANHNDDIHALIDDLHTRAEKIEATGKP